MHTNLHSEPRRRLQSVQVLISGIMASPCGRMMLRLPKSNTPLSLMSVAIIRKGGRRAVSGIALHVAGRSHGEKQFLLRTASPGLRGAGSRSGTLILPRQFSRGLTSGVDFNMLNMPALSPTMEIGTIAQWHKAPGDELSAGDVICDVETDKATVAFDIQDDGVLAKIISEAGSGEVQVGSPVAVIVEDVDAYEAFVKADAAGEVSLDLAQAAPAAPKAAEAPVAEAPKSTPTPAPVAASPVPEAVAPPTPKAPPVAAPVAPVEAAPIPAVAADKSGSGVAAHVFKREWGSGVSGSPLVHRMSTEQKKYIERYGSTLQLPLEL